MNLAPQILYVEEEDGSLTCVAEAGMGKWIWMPLKPGSDAERFARKVGVQVDDPRKAT